MIKNLFSKVLALNLILGFVLFTGIKSFATTQTISDTKGKLDTAYLYLSVKYYKNWSSHISLPDYASDDIVTVGSGLADRVEYHSIDSLKFSATNLAFLPLWERIYHGIYYANQVIFSETSSTQMVAEAKFIRAYFHFQGIKTFGEVPLHNTMVNIDIYNENSTFSNLFESVVTDLTNAIPDLPSKSEISDLKKRITKEAAKALLGKTYLFMASPYYNQGIENYDKAITIFDAIINSGTFALETHFDSIYSNEKEWGSESIFEIEQGIGEFSTEDNWDNGLGAYGDVHQQLDGVRGLSDNEIYSNGWGFTHFSNDLEQAFTSESDSIRKHGTILAEWQLNELGISVTERYEKYTGFFPKKKALLKKHNPTGAFWSWSTNDRIIRYADVLLMNAEAKYFSNKHTDAEVCELINIIRSRANLSSINLTGNELLNAIKLERRLELANEGHRFYDLVRWNDGPSVLGAIGFIEGENEHFSMPELPTNPVAYNENKKENSINIYPTPTNNILNIEVKGENINELKIFSITGKQVLSRVCNSEDCLKLNLSNLSKSIYIIEVHTNKNSHISRIIKD